MHGVAKFDVETGKQFKSKAKLPAYTKVFADALIAEAAEDERVVAVHAAMGGGRHMPGSWKLVYLHQQSDIVCCALGTGLNFFEKRFPDRTFDVGIAEQHAVTFAAGLACEGVNPFCTVYSTFLQRGFDQIVHDVALQNLPVRFAMDRAGA